MIINYLYKVKTPETASRIRSGFLTVICHDQKESGQEEQKRLKKIEDERQSKRYRAAELVKDGYSYRAAAEMLGTSHQFVSDWSHTLLDMRTVRRKVGGVVKRVRVCRFKEGCRGLLATRRPVRPWARAPRPRPPKRPSSSRRAGLSARTLAAGR